MTPILRRRRTPRAPRPPKPQVGTAIRVARVAVRLTQEQLGARLALKGRAVARWENDKVTPTRRNRAALVKIIGELNPSAATTLAIALGLAVAPPPPPKNDVVTLTRMGALQHAVFLAADALDVTPRRVRGPLLRFVSQLSQLEISLEEARQMLEAWRRSGDEPMG